MAGRVNKTSELCWTEDTKLFCWESMGWWLCFFKASTFILQPQRFVGNLVSLKHFERNTFKCMTFHELLWTLLKIVYFHCLLSPLYPLISCRNSPPNCSVAYTFQTPSPTIVHSHLPCKEHLTENSLKDGFPISASVHSVNGVTTAPSFSRAPLLSEARTAE